MPIDQSINNETLKFTSSPVITLFTRSLDYGGAERQLVELAKGLCNAGYPVTVLTFYPHGNLEKDLIAAGVPLHSLNKKGRWDIFPFFLKLCQHIRTSNTKILYAFLGVPGIMGLLASLAYPRLRLIWGVRASNVDLASYDWLSRVSYRIECRLSRYVKLIIANSEAGKNYALANGFPANKTIVIPNGIDIDCFKPDAALRNKVRAEWSIQRDVILIGVVARLDPMKDLPVFFQATQKIIEQYDTVRFVCVGDGPEPYKSELRNFADLVGLSGKVIWAGTRNDMTAVYNSLDILVSSSCSEGFPNVIAEAMACGVPCVVTDVGDSRFIVGDMGFIVPPKEPDLLADKLIEMINIIKQHENNPVVIRQHIVNNFSNISMVERTCAVIYDGKD